MGCADSEKGLDLPAVYRAVDRRRQGDQRTLTVNRAIRNIELSEYQGVSIR